MVCMYLSYVDISYGDLRRILDFIRLQLDWAFRSLLDTWNTRSS